MATLSVAFYGGLSYGFSLVQANREDLRATQILMQKTEAIRLCTWSELSNFSFQESYDPLGATNQTAGTVYYGTVATNVASSIPDTCAYKTNMCSVTINLYWTNYNGSKPIAHSRQMQTQVARAGLQNYIWGATQ